MGIWDHGLTPSEFMAASYLKEVSGRCGPTELAQVMSVSVATAKRTIQSLVDKGLIERLSRGRYEILWVSPERSTVSLEGSPVSLSPDFTDVYMTTSTSSHDCIEVPNGTSIQGGEPPLEVYEVKGFPVADDLPPGKLTPTPDPAPRRRGGTHRSAMRGWREDPREVWTIEHVAREFVMRVHEHNRVQTWHALPMYPDGKALRHALRDAQREQGTNVADMLAAMDLFFQKPPRAPESKSLVGHFMHAVSNYRASLIGDDLLQELEDEFTNKPGWGKRV
jgi:hypothetical protein